MDFGRLIRIRKIRGASNSIAYIVAIRDMALSLRASLLRSSLLCKLLGQTSTRPSKASLPPSNKSWLLNKFGLPIARKALDFSQGFSFFDVSYGPADVTR
jgi:hypothetical protein